MDITDPTILNIAKTVLRAEIEDNRGKTDELKKNVKNKAQNVRELIAQRRLLKMEIAKSEDHLQTINIANDKMRQTISDIKHQLEIAEAGQDTKISTMHLQKYKNVLKQFKETWAEYEAKYEERPLPKIRKGIRIDLEKNREEKECLEVKVSEKKKQRIETSRVNWEKAKAMTIEFAGLMIDSEKDCKKLEEPETECKQLRDEIECLESELKNLQKKEAELNAKAETKINFPKILDNLFLKPTEPAKSYRKKTPIAQTVARTVSEDSLTSLNSSILEEWRINVEEIIKNTDNITRGDTETAKPGIRNRRESTAQPVHEEEKSKIPSTKKQAKGQINHVERSQEISKTSRKRSAESQNPKEDSTEEGNMQTESLSVKTKGPKVVCVEKPSIQMKIINSEPAKENQCNDNEQEMRDLENNSTSTNNMNIVCEKADALPEFVPDESKANLEKDKSSTVNSICEQPMIDETMDIPVESNSITSSQMEMMEQLRNPNGMDIDNVSTVSTTLQNANNAIPNMDFEPEAESASSRDSIMHLKMFNCSFLSQLGDQNAVDNSSTYNERVSKQNEGDKDTGDKDNEDEGPTELNYGINFPNFQGNFQLF